MAGLRYRVDETGNRYHNTGYNANLFNERYSHSSPPSDK
jgi:hypothetical protein